MLRLNLVELVESLDLSCEDLFNVYEAALPLHDDSQFDAFTKQVRAHLCGRKWHYQDLPGMGLLQEKERRREGDLTLLLNFFTMSSKRHKETHDINVAWNLDRLQ